MIQTKAARLDDIRITVVYDNIPFRPGPIPEWGFSCLVEGGNGPILFDTGGSAQTLEKNLAVLGVDIAPVGIVFISHDHRDHTGGAGVVLADGRPRTYFMPHSMSSPLEKSSLEKLGQSVVVAKKPVKVTEASFSSGKMGSFMADEHTLAIDTDGGLIVISGCAHPGIVELVSKAKSLSGKEILLVMGGFHLMDYPPSDIRKIIAAFKTLGVRFVAPSHCTGTPARRLFQEQYGAGFIESGVGKVVLGKDLVR
ncbi:MAG: MBL fold metallo-hydrolase [Desulfobacterales bacterium]|nr:MBL fold metallo-hydrolase [Desulfobacterales bacterium]